MSHAHLMKKPTMDDLVLVRFAVPAKMGKSTASEVLIWTCAESVFRIPKTLLKKEDSKHFLFEVRVARDVAAAIRSMYGELFRMTRSKQQRPYSNG